MVAVPFHLVHRVLWENWVGGLEQEFLRLCEEKGLLGQGRDDLAKGPEAHS